MTLPVCVNSAMPIIERIDVSFNVITNWLMNEGTIIRIACGKITFCMLLEYGRPKLMQASYCPLSTAWIPPRIISAM